MIQQRVAAIMAGGAGERFWPLSRRSRPKQLLPLTASGKPMLEETIDRFASLIPFGNRYLLASREVCAAVLDSGIGLPPENMIAEPCKRNTAGCLALAAAHLLAQNGADPEHITMTVLPADGWVGRVDAYREALAAAMEAAEAAPVIAIIGLRPTRPETGYGYIEMLENDSQSFTAGNGLSVHKVASFREKPDREAALAYLDSGRFLWNSGIFVWRLSTFLKELATASPAHSQSIRDMAAALKQGDAGTADAVFESMPNISIDFALMEKSTNVCVVPGDFDWDDVGTWNAVPRFLSADAHGNFVSGNPVLADVRDCILYQDANAARMAVAALGVTNLVIVVTQDAVLVMPKDRIQDVRQVVDELKRRDAPQL